MTIKSLASEKSPLLDSSDCKKGQKNTLKIEYICGEANILLSADILPHSGVQRLVLVVVDKGLLGSRPPRQQLGNPAAVGRRRLERTA